MYICIQCMYIYIMITMIIMIIMIIARAVSTGPGQPGAGDLRRGERRIIICYYIIRYMIDVYIATYMIVR